MKTKEIMFILFIRIDLTYLTVVISLYQTLIKIILPVGFCFRWNLNKKAGIGIDNSYFVLFPVNFKKNLLVVPFPQNFQVLAALEQLQWQQSRHHDPPDAAPHAGGRRAPLRSTPADHGLRARPAQAKEVGNPGTAGEREREQRERERELRALEREEKEQQQQQRPPRQQLPTAPLAIIQPEDGLIVSNACFTTQEDARHRWHIDNAEYDNPAMVIAFPDMLAIISRC